MFALIIPFMLATCDLGQIFAEEDAWDESAVDFAVDHKDDGFEFTSQKRDGIKCMRRGNSSWNGIEVWEARMYYKPEGLQRLELSLYNRGDDKSGSGLSSTDTKELLDRIAAAAEPGGKIGSNPEKKKLKSGGYQFSKRFTKGPYITELAWGVDSVKAKEATTDFVKVTCYRKGESRPKSANKGTSGIVSKTKAKANVKKNAEGDVWIDNIPMVDQGQKGYCAAATAERLLGYYGFSIDEHEIAQQAGTTAKGGTSIGEMIETIKTVGSKCRLGFQSLVSMNGSIKDLEKELEAYNKAAKTEKEKELTMAMFTSGNMINIGELRSAMKPKVVKKARMKDFRYKNFLKAVKTQTDQGIPICWAVTLGMFPEPGLPQAAGGHIRMIIGYNEKTHEVLYSDSWGAGHELKRMPEDWAFTITSEAFSLKPL